MGQEVTHQLPCLLQWIRGGHRHGADVRQLRKDSPSSLCQAVQSRILWPAELFILLSFSCIGHAAFILCHPCLEVIRETAYCYT